MFINPQTAIKNGWISGLSNPEKQVQPNAIDFTADKAWRMESSNSNKFFISEQDKLMRDRVAFDPLVDDGETKYWQIKGRDMLDFLSDVFVDLPEGVAAQLVIRSSLARNGLQLVSGLYDSGFCGNIGFLLHNRHFADAFIAPGTRVGQIIFVESNSAGTYAGQYSHKQGTNAPHQDGGV